MKIPKYIEKALNSRVKAADKFNSTDYIISEFIERYDIEVEPCDYRGGVEALVNPDAICERIRQAIESK